MIDVITLLHKLTNQSTDYVWSTFPNIAFMETGPREQCATGISHWNFVSILAFCRLQSASLSLLPVVVLVVLLARFYGPFSSQSALTSAGSTPETRPNSFVEFF